jgi:hypothetical protein
MVAVFYSGRLNGGKIQTPNYIFLREIAIKPHGYRYGPWNADWGIC